MIGTPIAFGLTMIVCFTLFYYYWRIRQLRARLLSAQMAPVQELDYPVEFGIGKNVVETFPTIKACELKCTASEDLQCPICLVEYEEWEVLRQLPFCGHIFHTLCVGAWFEKQTTCPVCRMSMSELTESFGESLVAESIRMQCRRNSTPPADVTVEVGMVVNRRLSMSTTPPAPAATTELGTEETEPKSEVDVQVICEEPADFHVVNVPPQAQTCSKCKAATKTEMQQQSEPKTGESTEEASSQEISGMHIIPDGSCDAPGLTSANVQEDVQITVKLQPVLSQSSAGVNGSRC